VARRTSLASRASLASRHRDIQGGYSISGMTLPSARRTLCRSHEVPKRQVEGEGHHRHRTLPAPGQQVVLDAPPARVYRAPARRPPLPASRRQLHQVVHVDGAHAPVADLAGLHQVRHLPHGHLQRRPVAPVHQVAVDVVGGEPGQAALARLLQAPCTGVQGQRLAHAEDLVAPPRDGPADQLLGGSPAVHLGSVTEAQRKVQTGAVAGELVGPATYVLGVTPGPQSQRWQQLAVRERGRSAQGGPVPVPPAGSVPAVRRSPLARTACRPTAARTASGVPTTRTRVLARVTAV